MYRSKTKINKVATKRTSSDESSGPYRLGLRREPLEPPLVGSPPPGPVDSPPPGSVESRHPDLLNGYVPCILRPAHSMLDRTNTSVWPALTNLPTNRFDSGRPGRYWADAAEALLDGWSAYVPCPADRLTGPSVMTSARSYSTGGDTGPWLGG